MSIDWSQLTPVEGAREKHLAPKGAKAVHKITRSLRTLRDAGEKNTGGTPP